ncbi:MAG TPA: hypothetical protein VGZ02_08545 [Candidatus Baltobacteraceae bacterium]|jgi:hypothetical protein|nr:hypothetical protein [Candidatus Baltobacteraceae bacterium]
MLTQEDLGILLKRYGIHAPVTDERFLGHADVDRGIVLEIACEPDDRYGKILAVTCQDERVFRSCPLTREKASGIVDKLRRRGVLPDRAQERNTLTNLLVRCADLYSREQLESLELSPVYLRENDYRIGCAHANALGSAAVKPRLAPHAHDKGAVFAHRPTGRR